MSEEASIGNINSVSSEKVGNILGVSGQSIGHVMGVELGGADPFVAECQNTGKLFGLWTCQDVNTGDLADGATIMTDLSGNDRANLIATLAGTGDWQIGDSSGPGGNSTALTKYVSTDADRSDVDNFGAAASTWSDPVTINIDSDPLFYGQAAGFVIFYCPDAGTPDIHERIELVSYYGTAGTPQGSNHVLGIATYSQSPAVEVHGVKYGATGTNFSLSHGNSGASPNADQWWFVAWRLYNTSGASASANKFEGFVQQIGSNWGTNQLTWDVSPSCDPCTTIRTGLRFGYNTTGTPPADLRWAAHATFTGDIEEDTFESIYDAAGLGA